LKFKLNIILLLLFNKKIKNIGKILRGLSH